MLTVIKTRIVKIGNSQGIRIPKYLLEQSGLPEEVELEVQDDQIVIRAVQYPRADWDAAFQNMAEQGDDVLLDSGQSHSVWDESEWEWS